MIFALLSYLLMVIFVLKAYGNKFRLALTIVFGLLLITSFRSGTFFVYPVVNTILSVVILGVLRPTFKSSR